MVEENQKVEKYNKWKDPEWLKKYHRENHRRRFPIKTHPYIMEDGTKWSDSHPFGKFNSLEEKKENSKKYRKPTERVICETCGKDYNPKLLNRHVMSRHHKSAVFTVEFQTHKNISENTIEGQLTIDYKEDEKNI